MTATSPGVQGQVEGTEGGRGRSLVIPLDLRSPLLPGHVAALLDVTVSAAIASTEFC